MLGELPHVLEPEAAVSTARADGRDPPLVRPAPQLRAGRAERACGDLDRDVLVGGRRGRVVGEPLQDPCGALERAEQHVEDGRVELEPLFGAQHLGGGGGRAGAAVWAVGRDRVERVRHRGDPARQRDRIRGETARIARSVVALVMRPRDDRRGGVELGARVVQQRAPDLGVTVQPPSFGVAQRATAVDEGHRRHADVVEPGSATERVRVETQSATDQGAQLRHSAPVGERLEQGGNARATMRQFQEFHPGEMLSRYRCSTRFAAARSRPRACRPRRSRARGSTHCSTPPRPSPSRSSRPPRATARRARSRRG